MKTRNRNIEEILKTCLPSASQDSKKQVEDLGARVLHQLRAVAPDGETAADAHDGVSDSGPEEILRGRRSVQRSRWPRLVAMAAAIAAAVVIPMALPWSAPATLESADGGRRVEYGNLVRAEGAAGDVLVLVDGSRLEMRSGAELRLERAEDGVRVRLHKGGVIVNAAKQRRGHLYVQTKDVTVSVVGTVFLVNAEEEGSRVAVIEGEVRVQQGATEEKLRPGEQVATTPLQWQPVSEEISWSRSKETHLALLRQSTAAPSAGVEPRHAFEVVSVRPTANSGAAGPRGAGGVRRRNPRPPEEPCGSNNEPVIDPGRFDASDTTAAALFFWAYGLDCVLDRGSDRVFGGPDWFKNDGFDVLAVIPKGTPLYTREQLWAHDAPQLQGMLQTMLAERFQLVVHPETKEMPVFVLTAAQGGPRFIAPSTARRPAPVTQPGGRVVFAAGFAEPEPNGMSVWREGNDTWQSVGPGLISGKKKSMTWLAKWLGWATGRLVLDRTDLAGEFNYQLTFEPDRPMPLGFPVDTRSIFKAIEEDFGLKLEAKTEKVEVLVIDRVVRPSEN